MDNSARIGRARSRIQELQSEALAARARAPACSKCVYGDPEGWKRPSCKNPVYSTFRHDPHSGVIGGITGTTTTKFARSDEGLCGPSGILFERIKLYHLPGRLWRKNPLIFYFAAWALLVGGGLIAVTVMGRWS